MKDGFLCENCSGICEITQVDPLHCGSCGNICPSGGMCMNGVCTTHDGIPCEICDNACVDTLKDEANCGACGNACLEDGVCMSGVCSTVEGEPCIDYDGRCIGWQECQSIGPSCIYGGYAQWTLPGTPKAARDFSAEWSTIPFLFIVTDEVTGLQWHHASTTRYTWEDAKSHCQGLDHGGLFGWRLPTAIELMSIVDYTRSFPAIDASVFGTTPSNHFWTSSPRAGEDGRAWHVDFRRGDLGGTDRSGLLYVRCVR